LKCPRAPAFVHETPLASIRPVIHHMKHTAVEWALFHFREVLAHKGRVRLIPAKFDHFFRCAGLTPHDAGKNRPHRDEDAAEPQMLKTLHFPHGNAAEWKSSLAQLDLGRSIEIPAQIQ